MATFEQNMKILEDRAAKNDIAATNAVRLNKDIKFDPIKFYNNMVRVTNGGNSLNFAVYGNAGAGAEQVCDAVEDFLMKKQKIGRTVRMSMINLCGELCYSRDNRWITDSLAKNVLYILDGISDYMHHFKTINDPTNSVFHTYRCLTQVEDDTFVVITGTPEEMQDFINSSKKAEFIYKNDSLEIKDYDLDMLYDKFRDGIKESYKQYANEELREKFKEIAATYERTIPMKNQELANYLSRYSNSKSLSENQKLRLPNPYVETKTGIKGIVGLASVKETLNNFEKMMIFRKRAEMEGMKLPNTNMHMLFTGNPGTGKTTVARIISDMLYNLGIIDEDKVTEVSAKDLIAEYIGQTAVKTGEVIKEAMGGVLFIDEAYSLTINSAAGGSQFGEEALAVLIKAMEDRKGDFVVILAGYKDEMDNFININPGLESRIGYRFQFDDYSPEELTKIFEIKATSAGFTLGEGVLDSVLSISKIMSTRPNFGNGRFIDKVLDRAMIKHASMIDDSRNFKTLYQDEIPTAQEL